MADEVERNRLVAEFSGVTDVDVERAQFYLESAGWDLLVAISSFYDTMGEDEGNIRHEPPDEEVQQFEKNVLVKLRNRTIKKPDCRLRLLVILPAPYVVHYKQKPRSRWGVQGNIGGNIASLSSMQAEENSDSEGEEGQAFYAGGSERSGQQILGPPRKKQTSDDITQSIFDEAKRHGAEVVADEDVAGPLERQLPAFKGAGYRLGDTEGGGSQPLPETVSSRSSGIQQENKEVQLKFWSNGFSVDDGPLRSFDDPANEPFLSSVRRGEIPQELLALSRRGEVHVNMEDHRPEEYVPPPKPKIQAFSGAGHKLGSPAPEVKFNHSKEQDTSASIRTTAAPTPIDESQPVTSIQIRLADGTRMVSKFNHTSTVGDIRRFICASRPQMATRNFVLMTTFPNKELTDDGQKLKEANLLNAVIVQRFK